MTNIKNDSPKIIGHLIKGPEYIRSGFDQLTFFIIIYMGNNRVYHAEHFDSLVFLILFQS